MTTVLEKDIKENEKVIIKNNEIDENPKDLTNNINNKRRFSDHNSEDKNEDIFEKKDTNGSLNKNEHNVGKKLKLEDKDYSNQKFSSFPSDTIPPIPPLPSEKPPSIPQIGPAMPPKPLISNKSAAYNYSYQPPVQPAQPQELNKRTLTQTTSYQPKNILQTNLYDQQIVQVSPEEFKVELTVPNELTNDPSLNFVGMMIGPGGYTQKQMEMSTGCSVTVRGRGSSRNAQVLDPNRPMYVHIKSNTKAKVQAAALIVSELLKNPEKRDALRSQQMNLRNTQMNNSAQNYMNPSYYMPNQANMVNQSQPIIQTGQNVMRTPFLNSFKQVHLPNGHIIESIIIPVQKASLFGVGGESLEQLSYYSGANISLKDHGHNCAEVTIQGTKDQVELGRKKFQSVLESDPNEKNETPTDHLLIPNTIVGLLIGQKGDTIKRLMAETGCRMKVIPEYMTNPNEKDRKVLLFGNNQNCSSAKRIIKDIVNKHKTSSYKIANMDQVRNEIISVPCGCVGILIGKGGETIRSMGQRTNCRVQVVQFDEYQLFPGGVIQNHDLRHVSLKGDNNSIRKAKIEIQAIINEHAHRHGYEAPNLSKDNGDPYLGLQPNQYEQYLEQMKAHCNMDKKQVHEYYRSVLSNIAKESVEYAAQVKQYLARAASASAYYNSALSMTQAQETGLTGQQTSNNSAAAYYQQYNNNQPQQTYTNAQNRL